MKCKIHPCSLGFSHGLYKEELFPKTFLHFHLRLKMSSSTDSHVSSSSNHSSFNTDHFTSTSNDEQILENMDEDDLTIFHCMAIACDSHNFFTSHEIERG